MCIIIINEKWSSECFWGAKLFATLQKNTVPELAFLHLITALVTWHYHACRICSTCTSHSKLLSRNNQSHTSGASSLPPLYQWKAIILLDDGTMKIDYQDFTRSCEGWKSVQFRPLSLPFSRGSAWFFCPLLRFLPLLSVSVVGVRPVLT